MFHELNLHQIESMTGLKESELPPDFVEEYMTCLRMYHRIKSSGGAMSAELLIGLMRKFNLGPPTQRVSRKSDPVQWDRVKMGTKVDVHIEGEKLHGEFSTILPGGTIAVRLSSGRVSEYPQSQVSINVDEFEDLDKREIKESKFLTERQERAVEKEENSLTRPPKWDDVEPGAAVDVLGRSGLFVGLTPGQEKVDNLLELLLTVDIDGDFQEYPARAVRLKAS